MNQLMLGLILQMRFSIHVHIKMYKALKNKMVPLLECGQLYAPKVNVSSPLTF